MSNIIDQACSTGNVAFIKYIIEKYREHKIRISDNTFYYACRSGDMQSVEYVRSFYDILHINAYFTASCLHGNAEMFRQFDIKHISDTKIWDSLLNAARHGNTDIIVLLTRELVLRCKLSHIQTFDPNFFRLVHPTIIFLKTLIQMGFDVRQIAAKIRSDARKIKAHQLVIELGRQIYM